MRPSRSIRIMAMALLASAVVTASPAARNKPGKAAPAPPPAGGPVAGKAKPLAPVDEARVKKLARILRSADRRIVDAEIAGVLADDDPAIRLAVAQALGQIGDRKSVASLIKLSSDADASVRAAAAFGLGLVGDPATIERLVAMAADPQASVRRPVAQALGMIHDPASRETLLALLGDADLTVRAAADLAAWKFADPATLLQALIGNVGSKDPRVRATAGYALGRLASAASAPASSGAVVGHLSDADLARARAALISRASDGTAEVRMQVARGLAKPATTAELAAVGALSGDRDPGVRINAVKSIGYLGASLRPYLERAVADVDPAVARTALEALGKVCGGDVEDRLRLMSTKLVDFWRRGAALTSLAQCNANEVPAIVDGLLLNPDPVARLAALPLAAAHLEAKGARDAVKKLLADSDARVQAAAIPVVSDEDAPLGPLLVAVSASPDPVVRAAVADAYGTRLQRPRPGTESQETLLGVLEGLWDKSKDDTLPDARLSVLDAAAKAGKQDRVHAVLERGLADKDVVVRRKAVALFQETFGEDRTASIGPASDRPVETYEAIARWSFGSHAAVVTLSRPGYLPGRFTIALDARIAPMTAWNFAELAGHNFFDNRVVHRMVPNFVVQDGDPRGDGFGGPGYTIRDEFSSMEFTRGVLGMASDGKDTAGSQWFFVLSDQPHLDGRYTPFGHVVQGMRDVAGQILPGDKIVSIRVYDGDGTEPLPKD